jgi:hypothetical protein
MFKEQNNEIEIYSSMEKNLKSSSNKDMSQFQKLAKAIDHLNNVSKIFDKAGMIEESIRINNVLIDLSKRIK